MAKMKNITAFMTAAAMSLTMLASCGDSDSSKEDESSKAEENVSSSSSAGAKIAKGVLSIGAMMLVPSMNGYVNKSRLRTANANAKRLYSSLRAAEVDFSSDGKKIASKCAGKIVKFSDLNEGSDFDKKVYEYIGGSNLPEESQIYFEFADNSVSFAQWQNDISSPVGQYPNPATETSSLYRLGKLNR